MIKLIYSNTLDSAPILEEIKKKNKFGTKHLLLVPDRFSMTYQKEVLNYLNIKGTFNIEVSSFVRLASKRLPLGAKEFLSPQAEILLMRKVIEENKKQLKCYKSNVKAVGFAAQMYAVISQLRNSGVSVISLNKAIEQAPNKLANKLSDIALLYEGYIKEIHDRYIDGTSKLEALCDYLPTSDIHEYDVYISDFLDFNAVELNIIEKLILCAKSVTISVVDSKGFPNDRIYPKTVIERLKAIIKDSGNIIEEKYSETKLYPSASILSKNLFGYGKIEMLSKIDNVIIRSSKTMIDEVRGVASEIRRGIIEEGKRYQDFAIVCCNINSYSDCIQDIFAKYNIKYYLDRKLPILQTPTVRLLMSALKAAKNFKRKEILQLSKESILPLSFEERSDFETYVIKYGIDYNQFNKPFEKLGIAIDASAKEIENRKLNNAERVRSYLTDILKPLCVKVNDINGVVNSIEEFLKKVEIDKLCEEFSQIQIKLGYDKEADCARQAIDRLRLVFEQSKKMIGDMPLNIGEYIAFLQSSLAEIELSTIPLYLDSVFIGETQESRYIGVKTMYVIGANAGSFPLEHSDNGILADKETKALAKSNVYVEPNIKQKNKSEKLKTLMLLLKAERLIISYPQNSITGEKLLPSSTVNEIAELLDLETTTLMYEGIDKKYEFGSRENAIDHLLADASAREENIGRSDEVYDALYTVLKEKEDVDSYIECDSRKKFEIDKGVMLSSNKSSASQLEKYFSCPFKYFTDYCLRIKEVETSQFAISDTGTIMHAVLEEFTREHFQKELSDEELAKITLNILDKILSDEIYANVANHEKQRLAVNELKKRCVFMINQIYNKSKVSSFKPYKLEASFGMGGEYEAIELHTQDKTVYVRGLIDRIDICEGYVLVIDYKSKASMSYSLKELLFGERIQLVLYMSAIAKNEKLKTAGLLYLPLNNKFVKEDNERFKYVGLINTDTKVLDNIDNNFKGDGEYVSKLFPVKRNKRGELGGNCLLSDEKFERLGEYVIKLAENACNEIKEGFIEPRPLENACKYCQLKPLCAQDIKERTFMTSTALLKEKYVRKLLGDECDEQ